MSRLRLVVSQNSNPNFEPSPLDSSPSKMLRANSLPSPSLTTKVARLQQCRPAAAEVLEKLVDDLLAEIP